MRNARRGLIAAVLVSMFSGCTAGYKEKGAEKAAGVVSIDSCRVEPDTVIVNENDDIQWVVATTERQTYTIHFSRSPFAESTMTAGPQVPDKPHKAKRDFWCKVFGSCKFPYTLTPQGQPVCPDPGVHVIPARSQPALTP